MKQLNQTVENYLEVGRMYDYANRIFASFAEIYHYLPVNADFPLFQSDEVKIEEAIKNYGRKIKVYSSSANTKENYQFIWYEENDESKISNMIAMAVRILETFQIHLFEVKIQTNSNDKEALCNYLDCLDIDYQLAMDEKQDHSCFQIVGKVNDKEVSLAKGEALNPYSYSVELFLPQILACAGDFLEQDQSLDVVVTYQSEQELEHALYLTQELRLNGFKTEMIDQCDSSYIKEMYPTKYVISVREEELKRDEVTLVDLYTEEKETIRELDLINHLDLQV